MGADCSQEVSVELCRYIAAACQDICDRRERIYTETEQMQVRSRPPVYSTAVHDSTLWGKSLTYRSSYWLMLVEHCFLHAQHFYADFYGDQLLCVHLIENI